MPSIKMKKEKDCKGSVKYSTSDPKAVITNVYVERSFANPMPDEVTVSIGDQGGDGAKKSKKSKRDREEAPPEGEGE
jgi:hypothetical protein